MRKSLLMFAMPFTIFCTIGYIVQGEYWTALAWSNCFIYEFWLYLEIKNKQS